MANCGQPGANCLIQGISSDDPTGEDLPPPRPKRQERVELPVSNEDWDAFITRYTRGVLHASRFPKDNTLSRSASPATASFAQSKDVVPSDDISLDPNPPSPVLDPSSPRNEQREPPSHETPREPEPRQQEGESDAPSPAESDSKRINQDPDIPDIPSDNDSPDDNALNTRDFAYESGAEAEGESEANAAAADRGKALSTNGSQAGGKVDHTHDGMFRGRRAGDAIQEEGLTRENMRQLDIQAGQGKKRRTKRLDQVELASVARSESQASEEKSPSANGQQPEAGPSNSAKRRPSGIPRSRGSLRSFVRDGSVAGGGVPRERGTNRDNGSILLDSGTGSTTNSGSHIEIDYDIEAERTRVRDFYLARGYLPPPRQTPDSMRRRLRVIRRLGFDSPSWNSSHSEEIQKRVRRFVRLAKGFFKMTGAVIHIIGLKTSSILAAENFPVFETENESAICSHVIVAAPQDVLVVPDMSQDWRFRRNPFVKEGEGPVIFYAGAPLVIGKGPKAAVIGTLCVMDDKPRTFSKEDESFLKDLADGVVSELELLYTQTASIESAKLHQISVDFLRRSLKSRPLERAGKSRVSTGQSTGTASTGGAEEAKKKTSAGSSSMKRKEGADKHQSEIDIDIYDEACAEIRQALDAYAVAVVDLSQFHLFYPAFGGSSIGGSTKSSRTRRPGEAYPSNSLMGETTARGTSVGSTEMGGDVPNGEDFDPETYSQVRGTKRARKTHALRDPTAPSRTPQVLYIPSGRRTASKLHNAENSQDLAMLGYSCEHDNFAFNFTSSPAAKRIISDFIAANVKTRQVWYTRDDSEGIAQSINHLMPAGTETSMAMPIFGFDGQVSFAVVACWTDPLYTYPAGAMQFVETIAGSLLASVMKERLHQAERAQLNFAAAASHELRTPLHQINAAASLLRAALENGFMTPQGSPGLGNVLPPILEGQLSTLRSPFDKPHVADKTPSPTNDNSPNDSRATEAPVEDQRPSLQRVPSEDRRDALSQLEIIETNGLALGTILENIIDTLDIGRLTTKLETSLEHPNQVQGGGSDGALPPGVDPVLVKKVQTATASFDNVLEQVMMDSIMLEERTRRARGVQGMEDVEVVLEVLPRNRGTWKMAQDPGPLIRAIGKAVHNACKFTEKGYVHMTVQDVSRDVVLPAGYDNSIRTSIVSIDIKDTGKGMSAAHLEDQVLQPFSGTDSFSPGSGLGLRLAQRMIELLGGKLAVASTPGKGTLVHIEVPLHLFNEDNESDQDEMDQRGEGATALSEHGSASVKSRPQVDVEARANTIRLDGIYLVGFDSSAAIKRVGKSVLRQLKLNFCRVVPDIQYAALIIAPRSTNRQALLRLAAQARKSVEIVLIDEPKRIYNLDAKSNTSSGQMPRSMGVTPEVEHWDGISVRHVARPIRPSVLAEIMRPARKVQPPPDQFISPVVGGRRPSDQLSIENMAHQPGMTQPTAMASDTPGRTDSPEENPNDAEITDDDILASPDTSPVLGQLRDLKGTQNFVRGVDTLTSRMGTMEIETVRPHFAAIPGSASGTTTTEDTSDSRSVSHHSSASESIASDRIDIDESIDGARTQSSVGGQPVAPLGDSDVPQILRVLVVEDNDVNRKIITTMLKRTKCEWFEARDGEEAVEQYTACRPHLILLDINMPKKDGFEAAAEIRAIERGSRIRRPKLSTLASSNAQRSKSAISPSGHSRTTSSTSNPASPVDAAFGTSSRSLPHSPVATTSRDQGSTRTRIVAVTAMSSEAHRRKGIVECGIDVWLAKPVGIKVMREVVDRAKVELLGSGVET